MEIEKNAFAFRPENRVIETCYATYIIKTAYGWQNFQLPFQSITGWNMPKLKELKNDLN
jgi:hypothetical protein